mmetsp:Transcript_15531/g.43046  ORF Transcript_15531/g.43046 Transcript_15531/m.43046 type:complete len:88 (+) Transcript_15531:831-1094(+)
MVWSGSLALAAVVGGGGESTNHGFAQHPSDGGRDNEDRMETTIVLRPLETNEENVGIGRFGRDSNSYLLKYENNGESESISESSLAS